MLAHFLDRAEAVAGAADAIRALDAQVGGGGCRWGGGGEGVCGVESSGLHSSDIASPTEHSYPTY